MALFRFKYPGYIKNPKTVARISRAYRAGEFRLQLQGAVEKRPNRGNKAKHVFVNFLFWWFLTFNWPRRIFGYMLLVRDRHVRAALLDRTGRFEVFARADQLALFGHPPNLMGCDGVEHARQREVFTHILTGDGRDTKSEARDAAQKAAKALLWDARGKIDVLDDLLIPVLVETAQAVHGLPREDPHAFMTWTLRAAEQFIWPFPADELDMRRSFESARRLRSSHMRRIRADPSTIRQGNTLARMMKVRDDDMTICAGADGEIGCRAFLTDDRFTNMFMGFAFTVATQYVPYAHALNRVLKDSWLRDRAKEFAAEDTRENRDAMTAMVRECFRCFPATWPFVARKVNLEDGKPNEFEDGIRLRHGDTALISIPAALRDPEKWKNPWTFDETRTASGQVDIDLAFGVGPHACMGRDVAEAVAVEIFMALFSMPNVRPAGPMVGREGSKIPARLPVAFDAEFPVDQQVAFTAVIPINPAVSDVSSAGARLFDRAASRLARRLRRTPHFFVRKRCEYRARLRAEESIYARMRHDVVEALEALDSASADPVTKVVKAAGCIHGVCVTVVDLTLKRRARTHVIIELNMDGPEQDVARRAQAALGGLLEPALKAAGWEGSDLQSLLERFKTRTKPRLFGDSGLDVFGLPGTCVEEIEAEHKLAKFAEDELHSFCKTRRGNVAVDALDAIRNAALKKIDCRGEKKFEKLLLRPRSRAPKFASHEQLSASGTFRKWLCGATGLRIALVVLLAVTTVPAAILTCWLTIPNRLTAVMIWLGFTLLILALLVLTLGLLGLLFWRRLRAKERADLEDERQPFLDAYVDAMGREDKAGQGQNHMALVVERKPGRIRRVTLFLSLVVISWMNRHWFRPGWAQDIGSIRHARVVGLAGAREVVFLSSFDGSWSSYVGEFSDRATKGMSMFWSNFTGFVRTNNLVFDGAQDDDRFKRWVRTRQVPASLVRQRFPKLSNNRIRRNALIREGLSRVLTRSEAERWMRLFGSDPRSASHMIAPDEIQSIVFKSFGRYPASACVAVQIADGGAEQFRGALATLSGMSSEAPSPDAPLICFGEDAGPGDRPVAVVGFSASGLEKLGVPADHSSRHHAQLYHFPMPFVEGMGRRTRTLGDCLPQDSADVEWIDRVDGHPDAMPVDAVFLVYAPLDGVRKRSKGTGYRTESEILGTTQNEKLLSTKADETAVGKTQPDEACGTPVGEARDRVISALTTALNTSICANPRVIKTEIVKAGGRESDNVDPVSSLIDAARYALAVSSDEDTHPKDAPDRGDAYKIYPGDPTQQVRSALHQIIRQMIKDERQRSAVRRRRRGLGFADGVSQPLLRGSPGVAKGSPSQIAPGEFILGLPDDKGLITPSPEVPAGWDLHSDLSDIHPLPDTIWPDFSAQKPFGRDLGRNGTFMVIRQLQVNDVGFKKDLEKAGRDAGATFEDDAAKAIGRRRDGSLIGSPLVATLASGSHARDGSGIPNPEFQSQDPFGFDVPLGSHVRRSNPRDSMSEEQFSVDTLNRHRIIRRGRSYINDKGDIEGLIFVALNANIERQFEFIQQTWINNPFFHGLFGETDPLLGRGKRKFSMPSPDGPRSIFLEKDYAQFQGGGYFFVPSKSALRALTRARSENHDNGEITH